MYPISPTSARPGDTERRHSSSPSTGALPSAKPLRSLSATLKFLF